MKKIAFWLGYSVGFNGKNYKTKKIGGTELTILKVANMLSNDYNITIFSYITNDEVLTYNNIKYDTLLNINNYKEQWDTVIISRYLNYFIYVKHNSKKTILWLHDSVPHYNYLKGNFYNYGIPFFYNIEDKLNNIICVSQWQKQNITNIIKEINKENLSIIENPFDNDLLQLKINLKNKTKNSFIYFTDLDRGFELLLDCLLYLEQFYDDLSLIFFKNHQLTEKMKLKLNQFKTTKIKQYGFVNQDVIFKELTLSEYYFYPLLSHETFCCCAIEAILFKNVCIYNNKGALSETIRKNGLEINYNIKDKNYVQQTCLDVIKLMNNDTLKKQYIDNALLYVKKKFNNNLIKTKWQTILNNDNSLTDDKKKCLDKDVIVSSTTKFCFVNIKNKVCFINIPKNCSTYIRTKYNLTKYVEYGPEYSNFTKILILRDPNTRIISCYSEIMKLRKDGPWDITKNTLFYKKRNNQQESFNLFCKYISNKFYDPHLYPQIWFLKAKGLNIKDIDYVFDQKDILEVDKVLKNLIPETGGKGIRWEKQPKYKKIVVNPNIIENLYSEDLKLYNNYKHFISNN